MTIQVIYKNNRERKIPIYLYILSFLVSLVYILLSYLVSNHVNNITTVILILGSILTPILIFSTIGEIKEVVVRSGKEAFKNGCTLIEVLPDQVTNCIRYKSIALLFIAVMSSASAFVFQPFIWYSLIVMNAVLLYKKTFKGFKGYIVNEFFQ